MHADCSFKFSKSNVIKRFKLSLASNVFAVLSFCTAFCCSRNLQLFGHFNNIHIFHLSTPTVVVCKSDFQIDIIKSPWIFLYLFWFHLSSSSLLSNDTVICISVAKTICKSDWWVSDIPIELEFCRNNFGWNGPLEFNTESTGRSYNSHDTFDWCSYLV